MVHAKRRKRKPGQPIEQICEDEIAVIPGYLSSSLSSRVLRTFEEHLQGCHDCTAFLQTYKKTIEVTRSFFMDEVSDKIRTPALRVPNGDGNRH
jgi:hypothetical protein